MRGRVVPVAVVLLCIVALGLGAATLTSVSDGGGGDPLVSAPNETHDRSEGEGQIERETGEREEAPLVEAETHCIAGYDETDVTWVAFLVAIGASVLVFVHRREVTPAVIAFPLVLFSLLLVISLVFAALACPTPGEEVASTVDEQNTSLESVDQLLGSEDGETTAVDSHLRLGGLFLAFVVAVVLAGLYASRHTVTTDVDEESTGHTDQQTQLGAVAGTAVAEFESDVPLENAVYRAWAAMTRTLDIENPTTATPAEFEEAALRAGLDRENVSELTALFEEVRYGTAPPTAEREERARAALRRIEQRHANSGEHTHDGES